MERKTRKRMFNRKPGIPEGAIELDHRRLAEGEATGHYHEATSPSAILYQYGDSIILDAPDGTDIVHQEHDTVTLPPGIYRRLIVREYDHLAEEARRVVD